MSDWSDRGLSKLYWALPKKLSETEMSVRENEVQILSKGETKFINIENFSTKLCLKLKPELRCLKVWKYARWYSKRGIGRNANANWRKASKVAESLIRLIYMF